MEDPKGAWQSDVFDNGRDFKPHDKAPANVTAGTTPPMYNVGAGGSEGNSKALSIISIVLRCLSIMFNVVSLGVIASNQGKSYFVVWRTLNSSNMQYLFAINVIVLVYCVVQLILSIINLVQGKMVLSGPTQPASTITYICDQGLTYMLMAGFGAGVALQASVDKGESGMLDCSGANEFCGKNKASAALSFLGFVCIALSANLNYLRLYFMAAK
ncbi:CASP-like protein UU2 [Physcomitrium patens]|uniref:CASP-like protein UU2 n=2 Tax=Physcomitrium patens TaxID=3218 RepID=CSPL5_PHYPA|nr:CASP-like protein UU2 [Physcomitrium patens]A9SHQ9.3 RecName: Full=CASP-like protein UU2; Short=PpCASPLUU2 [Physcomitrium patens]PNR45409.1 hypothetical protein PHYPA_015180 [Physcomitrium patens]|eukprot:XP_024388037.1 CASP-like protein UU2 [Physcomitrella patens]